MSHFLLHWLGLDNASGAQYLFWSGIFGDVTIFAAGIGLYFHNQCHDETCKRWGRHKVNGSPYCKLHKTATIKK